MTIEQRRLAAIVSADVAGYSRLMGRDETGTLAALKALRQEVVDPAIASHGGRIVKTTGDGLLLEFPSVVNAVRCAVEVQTAMADRTAGIAEEQRLAFRIGINIGDIIVDGDDIFGDGVNVAARLQEIAAPGGICVSARVHEDVRDRLDAAFDDGGTQTLKNIARPVQVWRWQPATVPPKLAPAPSALPLPDKPSIAVLPFQNMSGDPEQEYFADGIVEDIITALSRFKSLFVIARNSSFTYKGKAMDVRQVGRELGVRYVLEGSVRKAGGQVRITGQLIEASTGEHLWAERYDRNLSDVFTLQDEITVRIATAVDPAIRDAQTKAALRKHPTDLGAWDHLLRGLWHLNLFRQAANEDGRREFLAAIESDPDFAPAHATLAISHVFDAWFNWTEAHAASLERAHKAAAFAVKLDPQEPLAHVATALACFWTGRMEQAKSSAELAISLNPNSFLANYTCGVARNYLGECEAAVPYHLKALDLSPNDPLAWNCLGSLAHTHFNLGKFNDAVDCANRAIVLRHGYLFGRVVKTAALGREGRRDEAAASLRAIFDISPDFSLRKLEHYPFVLDSQRRHLFAGLEKAGLPITPTLASLPAVELALPDKPSIAVLPFQNMSGDPEQEYFADGLAEDLITGLSRVSWLFVIARNSSFAFRGEKLDVRSIGERLGVRYLVEGSVRRAGPRLRLTAQLIEAATGNHLWADRYDGSLEDVFDFQDRIVASLLGAIEPKLWASEIARARRKRPDSLDAYDLLLQALPKIAALSAQSIAEAIELLDRAIGLSPDYAQALAYAAFCRSLRPVLGCSPEDAKDFREADELSRRALDSDPAEPIALRLVAFITAMLHRDYQTAWDLIDRSLAINANDAQSWNVRGWINAWAGETKTAVAEFEKAMRLSPLDPLWDATAKLGMASALFWGGRPDEALPWARKALQERPDWSTAQLLLIAVLWQSGRHTEAREAVGAYVAMFPGFSLRDLRKRSPRRLTSGQDRYHDALRLAGLPE